MARPPSRYAVADSRDGRTVLADQGHPALGPRENVIDLPEGPSLLIFTKSRSGTALLSG